MDTPEDRGPSSLRIVKFNPKNPIHEGLMQSRDINRNIDVNPKGHIVMPVAPGMEKNISSLTSSQIKSMKAAVKAGTKFKTDAPSMVTPKDAGKIYDPEKMGGGKGKKRSKEEMTARANATAAAIKAKREGKP